jgi:hypothetical protein
MPPASAESGLRVAVTGPTGTFGLGLVPLLQADGRIERIIGVARRPFDPAAHGWSTMDYRRGDVRDRIALEAALAGADVVSEATAWLPPPSRCVPRSPRSGVVTVPVRLDPSPLAGPRGRPVAVEARAHHEVAAGQQPD